MPTDALHLLSQGRQVRRPLAVPVRQRTGWPCAAGPEAITADGGGGDSECGMFKKWLRPGPGYSWPSKALLAAPVGPKAGTWGAWLLPGCGSTAAAPSRHARLEAASRIEACRCESIRPRADVLAGEAFLNCGCGGAGGRRRRPTRRGGVILAAAAALEGAGARSRVHRVRRGLGRLRPGADCWQAPTRMGSQTAAWCSRLPRVARRLQRVGTGLTVRAWQGSSSG